MSTCASLSVCKCAEVWRAGAGDRTGRKAVAHLWWWHSASGEQGPEIPTGDVRQRFALPVQAWRAQKRPTAGTAQPWKAKRHW